MTDKISAKKENREQWGGRFGFVMATAGSAVGLGNIMKFPYITGRNGGAAFLFVYIIVLLVVRVSMLMCDFLIGRNGKSNAVDSYKKISKKFAWMGYLGIFAAMLALSYYAVFGGWMLYYVINSFGPLASIAPDVVYPFFAGFTGSVVGPLVGTLVFLLLTMVIVMGGIKNGIEKASKIMMPTLLVILIVLVFRSLTLDGALEGIEYYLKPDFSLITFSVVAAAVGQVFFSLNVGTTGMVNYGSYLSDKENVPKSTAYIVFTDFAVAFFAGLIVIPSAFAFGIEPGAGPALLFVTMPGLFAQLPAGGFFCFLFFVLLLFASLTSSVSILEIFVPFVTERFSDKFDRKSASILGTVICLILAIPVSFSFGIWESVSLFGMSFFELYDNFICLIAFPSIAIGTAILVAWVWGKDNAVKAYTNHGTLESKTSTLWFTLVKYVCPVFLVMVLLTGFGIIK